MKTNILNIFLILVIFSINSVQSAEKAYKYELYNAALFNKEKEVKELLDKGINPNFKYDDEGNTPLMAASMSGNVNIVVLLINAKADVNAATRYGRTAIFQTMISGKDEKSIIIIDILLKAGANINSTDLNQVTPLLWAANLRAYPIIKHLLERGANYKLKDKNGESFLDWLVNPEIAKIFEEFQTSINKLLIDVAKDGDIEAFNGLIERITNINNFQDEYGFTAIMRAAQASVWQSYKATEQIKANKLYILKELLKFNPDLEIKDKVMRWTALRWAKESNNQEAVKLLMEAGAKNEKC